MCAGCRRTAAHGRDHLMPGGVQSGNDARSDKTVRARNQYAHRA